MILRVKTTAIVTLEKCTQQLVLHSDAASSLQRRFTSSPPRDEPLGKSHRKSAWQWRHDDDFHSKLHNYIITINKLDTVWLTCGDGGCFLGESSLKSRQEDWRSRWFIIKVSCQWQMLFFGQKCAEEQDGRFSRCDCDISFLKCPKTVTVFMLLLFGPVTLLCGTFLWRMQTAVWMGLVTLVCCQNLRVQSADPVWSWVCRGPKTLNTPFRCW